jgi:hypothetical protein
MRLSANRRGSNSTSRLSGNALKGFNGPWAWRDFMSVWSGIANSGPRTRAKTLRVWVLGINGTENPLNDTVTKPRNGESIPWAMPWRISGCQSRKITSVPARADKTAAVSSITYKSTEFLRQLSVPLSPNTLLLRLVCSLRRSCPISRSSLG